MPLSKYKTEKKNNISLTISFIQTRLEFEVSETSMNIRTGGSTGNTLKIEDRKNINSQMDDLEF